MAEVASSVVVVAAVGMVGMFAVRVVVVAAGIGVVVLALLVAAVHTE